MTKSSGTILDGDSRPGRPMAQPEGRGTGRGPLNRRDFVTFGTAAAVLAGATASAATSLARATITAEAAAMHEPRNGAADPSGEDVAAGLRYTRERRFLDTPFGRIAYIDRGAGRPTLL